MPGAGADPEPVDAVDVLGLSSTLSYHRREADPESHDSRLFSSMTGWFTSNWACWPEIRTRSQGAMSQTP